MFERAFADAERLLESISTLSSIELMQRACELRREGHGDVVTYSSKVFIPLTRLCRDTCGYCTFARTPRELPRPYLMPEEVLEIARAGERAGCREALFTLGDNPELRYAAARTALAGLGYASTIDYLEAMCAMILEKTSLLPHVNPGLMTEEQILRLRRVSVSQGIMLETISARLGERGGPHFGCPDKTPAGRVDTIATAGRLRVPFSSGILMGIGETRLERVASLFALEQLHAEWGHIQEVIVQNFRAKPRTRLAGHAEPNIDELLWTAAVARLVFGPEMNIQIPPNLSYSDFPRLLSAGINDWGGISPVTVDHVNPEAPWPQIERLAAATAAAGLSLSQRLAIYPAYATAHKTWLDPRLHTPVLRVTDSLGFPRSDTWMPGSLESIPAPSLSRSGRAVERLVARATAEARLDEAEVLRLFEARDGAVEVICAGANDLRRKVSGDVVRYVVNRNINYTNVCTYRCGFCAFSKGRSHEALRGKPYDLALEEVARRVEEAWNRGATEVCMQGGINPHYTGETYLNLLAAVKAAAPGMHIHAFSPLEVSQGAHTLGISVRRFLEMLRDAGLGSLPGTAAEILDDDVRAEICPDKLSSAEWLEVIETAHTLGLKTTATIMFGHVEHPRSWARHLLALRDLQERTGGFTEFVPLPFVHMEAPMALRGRARPGPTWREVRLMHAVGRLVLHPAITNIQASWVKLGEDGISALLNAGVNDLGGTLMNESISRAAGTLHGQELAPERMERLIRFAGRIPQQRTTLYRPASRERRTASFNAPPLAEMIMNPFAAKVRPISADLVAEG